MSGWKQWKAPPDSDGVPLIDTLMVGVMLGTEFGGEWPSRRVVRWLRAHDVQSPRRGPHGVMLWRHADVMDELEKTDAE